MARSARSSSLGLLAQKPRHIHGGAVAAIALRPVAAVALPDQKGNELGEMAAYVTGLPHPHAMHRSAAGQRPKQGTIKLEPKGRA